jgi:hypothetical protein
MPETKKYISVVKKTTTKVVAKKSAIALRCMAGGVDRNLQCSKLLVGLRPTKLAGI